MSWAIPLQLVSWVLVAFAGYRVGYVSCIKRTLQVLDNFEKNISKDAPNEALDITEKFFTAVRMLIDALV